jgi:hypothetical protein
VPDPELKWWHVRWRLAGHAFLLFAKILAPLALLAALASGVFYLLSPWLFAQRMANPIPG